MKSYFRTRKRPVITHDCLADQSLLLIYYIIKDMNEFIEERKICQERVVYSKKELC